MALAYANEDLLSEEQRNRSNGGRSSSGLRSQGSSGLRRGRSIEEELMEAEEQRLRSSGIRGGNRGSSGLRRGRSIEEEMMEAEEQRLRSSGSRGGNLGSSGVRRG